MHDPNPVSDITHDDPFAPYAHHFEQALSQIYLIHTLEALLVAIVGVFLILYYLPLSTFAILQCVGWCLMVITLGKFILDKRRKKALRQILILLEAKEISCSGFEAFVSAHHSQYELAHATLTRLNRASSTH